MRKWISWCFVSTFNRFISATSNSFSSKRYKWKNSQKSRKKIYGWKFLVPLHLLNNIEITNYFKYEPKFNGVCSRNILPRIKDEAYVNVDNKKSREIHWISLFIDRNTAVYFDYFVIEYIPQKVLNKVKYK